MATPGYLFEDRFVIRSIDNSKFEKVTRVFSKSTGFDAELALDVHNQLFPLSPRESIYVGITSTLAPGTKHDKSAWEKDPASSVINKYDYVMYGKVFKIDEVSSERRTVYASFGGLLMSLTADKQAIGDFELDVRIYILIKRFGEVMP